MRDRDVRKHVDMLNALTEAREERDKAQKETERLREALEQIAFPIKHLQQEAEREGAKLDGAMAIALSNDANWLKNIAKKALEGSGE